MSDEAYFTMDTVARHKVNSFFYKLQRSKKSEAFGKHRPLLLSYSKPCDVFE